MQITVNLGLCNRLRSLFSHLEYCNQKKEKLFVNWDPDKNCPGHFLDLFEPIEGLYFNHECSSPTYGACKHNFDANDIFLYKQLKVKKQIINKVKDIQQLFDGEYNAIHVRRTDHILIRKQRNVYQSDELFFNFIEENKDKPLYIATDNLETQKIFYDKFAPLIKYIKFIQKSGFRHTSLEDSVIDLYLCIGAKKFKGTGWSSFSGLIRQLRNNT
jgi:hypothetical protein